MIGVFVLASVLTAACVLLGGLAWKFRSEVFELREEVDALRSLSDGLMESKIDRLNRIITAQTRQPEARVLHLVRGGDQP